MQVPAVRWTQYLEIGQSHGIWRKKYGGLRRDQARELKALKKENAQLKKLVADLSLDKEILKVAAEGTLLQTG
jgi:cell division protein FtsB